MKYPLVTIGLPTYNNAATIQTCVQSILAQTYTDWELIITIDGSTDQTYDVIKQLTDPRIIIINNKENKGLIYRLNQIIDMAQGRYICRVDADDMMLPEKVAEQVSYLMLNPEVDVVDTAIYSIDGNDNPTGVRGQDIIDNATIKDALKKSLLIHPTAMGKTEWFKANNYAKEFERAEDYELWCRTFSKSVFRRLTTPLYIYREGRVSVRNYNATMKSVRKVLFKHGYLGLNRAEVMMEILKTYLKGLVYSLFGYVNRQNLLADKRSMKISAQKAEFLTQYIHYLKNKSLS